MYDYYRVRFRKLVGPRRPTSRTTLGGPKPVKMPTALRLVYSASCVLAGLGWLATVALGRSSPLGTEYPWVVVLSLLLPVSAAIALGFSEQQSWTRPLLVIVLLLPAAALALCKLTVFAALLSVLTVFAVGYLYGSPGSRAYYGYLRENAIVRVEMSDLRSVVFVPLYTTLVGILLGLWLGYRTVTRHLGYSSGLGVHDVVTVVYVGVLLAILFGLIGRWIGEALASRLSRAA